MPPSLAFSILLALTLAFLFHAVFGRKLWQLPLMLVAALIGMTGGFILGSLAGWHAMMVGNVPSIAAAGGTIAGLAICWFFTTPLDDTGKSRLRHRRRGSRRARGAST